MQTATAVSNRICSVPICLRSDNRKRRRTIGLTMAFPPPARVSAIADRCWRPNGCVVKGSLPLSKSIPALD
jgi:hypothetical protein